MRTAPPALIGTTLTGATSSASAPRRIGVHDPRSRKRASPAPASASRRRARH